MLALTFTLGFFSGFIPIIVFAIPFVAFTRI